MVETIVNSLNRFFESNNVFLDLYRISDNKINKILIKYNNKFYLIDRRCPHNGLPLVSSLFFGNYIKCRWHGRSVLSDWDHPSAPRNPSSEKTKAPKPSFRDSPLEIKSFLPLFSSFIKELCRLIVIQRQSR